MPYGEALEIQSRIAAERKQGLGIDHLLFVEHPHVVTIGRNVIMWSGNHIGHHTRIGDNCFIASQAVISGNCEIGAGSFIGVNATLRDNIQIGARNVIGAGTLILQSSPDNAVFVGPATPPSKVTSDRLRSI